MTKLCWTWCYINSGTEILNSASQPLSRSRDGLSGERDSLLRCVGGVGEAGASYMNTWFNCNSELFIDSLPGYPLHIGILHPGRSFQLDEEGRYFDRSEIRKVHVLIIRFSQLYITICLFAMYIYIYIYACIYIPVNFSIVIVLHHMCYYMGNKFCIPSVFWNIIYMYVLMIICQV